LEEFVSGVGDDELVLGSRADAKQAVDPCPGHPSLDEVVLCSKLLSKVYVVTSG
jgi:hypothetical protein